MNIAVIGVCVVLMVLGIAELLRVVVFWWQKPLTEKKLCLVVTPESGEDCECLVRAAAERMGWLEWKAPCRLVCLNLREDPEIDKICGLLSLRYPYLRVSKPEDLLYNCNMES